MTREDVRKSGLGRVDVDCTKCPYTPLQFSGRSDGICRPSYHIASRTFISSLYQRVLLASGSVCGVTVDHCGNEVGSLLCPSCKRSVLFRFHARPTRSVPIRHDDFGGGSKQKFTSTAFVTMAILLPSDPTFSTVGIN